MAKAKPVDPKTTALRDSGCLNRRPSDVADPLFRGSTFFDARDIVQVKYEMVRRVEIDSQTVTAAAAGFGFSRPSFYQAQATLSREGLAGLVPKKRGPRGGHKLTVELVEFLEKERAKDAPSAPELAARVQKRFGVDVHPRSIERALSRSEKKPNEWSAKLLAGFHAVVVRGAPSALARRPGRSSLRRPDGARRSVAAGRGCLGERVVASAGFAGGRS